MKNWAIGWGLFCSLPTVGLAVNEHHDVGMGFNEGADLEEVQEVKPVMEVKSVIQKVTVFQEGAQIQRSASFQVQPGKQMLIIPELSAYVSEPSIRISSDGNFTVNTVQFKTRYSQPLGKSDQVEALEQQKNKLVAAIKDQQVLQTTVMGRLEFLNTNRAIAAGNNNISPDDFAKFIEIYGKELEELQLQNLKYEREIARLREELSKVQGDLQQLQNQHSTASGALEIEVEAQFSKRCSIEITYLSLNASWTPSYDFRFNGSDQPLDITYKADVRQQTGVDWEDVELALSTANPNVGANLPELRTMYALIQTPEFSVRGARSGTSVQFIDGVKVRGKVDVPAPDDGYRDLAEVVGTTAGVNQKAVPAYPAGTTQLMETTKEFLLTGKQSVTSNTLNTTLTYRKNAIAAQFEFEAVPKLAPYVYLIAHIPQWYGADLLSGPVNIYLENTFVGQSALQTNEFSDTLDVSFGPDQNLEIEREKTVEFIERKMGGRKMKTLEFTITVRNNKNYSVHATVSDQIPVSYTDNVDVETLELSGAVLDGTTGKLSWELDLPALSTQTFVLRYAVKYPKEHSIYFR